MIPAGRIFTWLLKKLDFHAIAMPWGTTYCLPEHLDNQELSFHESVHQWQIARDGPIRFSMRYLYWTWRYGYDQNPYEIEARSLTSQHMETYNAIRASPPRMWGY